MRVPRHFAFVPTTDDDEKDVVPLTAIVRPGREPEASVEGSGFETRGEAANVALVQSATGKIIV